MSSPSKSPTMESVDQWSRSIHPHHKASVTDNQQVASALASASAAAAPYSPKEKKPQTLPQPQPLITAPNNVNETASLTTNVVSGEVSDDESIDFSNNQKNAQKDDEFFKSFPPGYRFNPQDDELVVYYLKKKVLNKPLPPNRIREVNLYRHNPETLAEKYERYGEKEWYFFTPRDRKYRNGNRPNRAAGDGYWKATGADKQVRSEGAVVGYRKALVFYRGKPPKGDKTNWIMHEFRVDNPPVRIKRCANDMRLDDWVLCRIYKKVDKNNKIRNREDDCTAQIGSKSMEIEVEIETSNQCDGTIVDPLPEYDHGMTYSNYAYQHFHQVGVPNYQLPNNMVSMNGVMSSTANRMQVPPVTVRAPIMSYNSESLFGPKYIEETSLPEEIFDMKALGNPIYTNNYSGQFMHFDYVLPYPEDIDE